jgi:hypothetical protein
MRGKLQYLVRRRHDLTPVVQLFVFCLDNYVNLHAPIEDFEGIPLSE